MVPSAGGVGFNLLQCSGWLLFTQAACLSHIHTAHSLQILPTLPLTAWVWLAGLQYFQCVCVLIFCLVILAIIHRTKGKSVGILDRHTRFNWTQIMYTYKSGEVSMDIGTICYSYDTKSTVNRISTKAGEGLEVEYSGNLKQTTKVSRHRRHVRIYSAIFSRIRLSPKPTSCNKSRANITRYMERQAS